MRIPFEGRGRVVELMREIFGLVESVRVVREVSRDEVQLLEIETRLAGYDMHMVQVVEHDAAGKVHQVTLFMRPLPGVANLAAHLGPRLVRLRYGRVVAAFSALPLYLAAWILKLTDRLSPRFV
jgi:hypothetical protein